MYANLTPVSSVCTPGSQLECSPLRFVHSTPYVRPALLSLVLELSAVFKQQTCSSFQNGADLTSKLVDLYQVGDPH